MSRIDVKGLTFAYDGSYDNVFEDVSFAMDTDWKLGFVGRNGRGKTTFLKLLLGEYAYSGTIDTIEAFDYFPFDVKDTSRNTEDAARCVHPNYEGWELLRELSLLNVSPDVLARPFNTLSNGEQTKVLLAALFLKENRFLLIDEPTNHLDMDARRLVGNYLKSKKGFILVSHDRAFLDSCVDHVLSINRAGIDVQRGNFSSWWANKEKLDQYELSENSRLKKDIKRLADAARQTKRWSDKVEASKIGGHTYDRGFIGHKSAKMMKRSKSTLNRQQDAVEQKSKLLKNIESADALKLSPLIYIKRMIGEVRDLSVMYGGRTVFDDLRFDIERHDRIALTGRNGCGKSSLLKLLAGEDVPHAGTVRLGGGLIISVVPQDTSFLAGDLREYIREQNIDESLFKAVLRKLDFSREQFEKKMEAFSGGQKKKVLIARSLCEPAHLYLWDEPLNYIDVLSRVQIEELIKSFTPTMIFVEHDAAFVDAVATKRIEL